MEKEKSKSPAPPYVPYRTLMSFLERFKQGVPNRIGTDLMRSMSGGMRSQLVTSLRSFGLVNDGGAPQDKMRKLCASEGSDRQRILKDLVESCYPYLFREGFEFSTTTMSLLREAIQENTTANGETVTRCVAFLKEAAGDAGIPVSPFLQETKSRTPGPRAKRTPRQERNTRREDHPPPPGGPPPFHGDSQPIPAAQSSLLLWGLFQRLPTPRSPWSKDERAQWVATLQNVLAMEYPEQ